MRENIGTHLGPLGYPPSPVKSEVERVLSSGLSWRNVRAGGIGGSQIAGVVDDRDTNLTYVGTWTEATANWGYMQGTYKHSKTAGDSVTYTFTGDYIAVMAVKSPDAGQVKVYIDGTLDSTVDLYSATTIYSAIVYSKSVQDGQHTIKIEVDSVKNASSTDYYFYFDGLLTQRQLTMEHLEVSRIYGTYTITTDAAGAGSAEITPLTGYTIFALAGVHLATGSGTLEWEKNTVYVRGGPASGSITVNVTAVMLKKK